MKKVIIVISSLLLLVAGVLVAVPRFFKDDLLRLVERQFTRYTRGELRVGDMRVNMFRNFPNLNVTLTDVQLSGTGAAGDTLILVPRFDASVNLRSLILGNEIVVNRLLLKDARLALRVDTAGNANWDIMLSPANLPARQQEQEESEKSIRLNHVVIDNLSLAYDDVPGALHADVQRLSLHLQGNFSTRDALLALTLRLQNVTLRLDNTTWLSNIDLAWDSEIAADLHAFSFDVKRSDLALNDLKLDLAGTLAKADDAYCLDLSLNAPDTRFESLLALVPGDYRSRINGVKTTGTFHLHATARGNYREGVLPAIDLQLGVADASLQYPNLPEIIEHVNLDLHVTNPGKSVAATSVDLSKLSFSVAGNPFEIRLRVTDPTDPAFNGALEGTLHFESLKRALPLEQLTIEGICSTNLHVEGKYSSIKRGEYEKLSAKGLVNLQDLVIKNDDFPGGITIPGGEVAITPTRVDISKLHLKVNSSAARLEGYLANYLPYLLQDEVLEGNLTLVSSLLDLNELYGNTTPDTITAPASSPGAIEIPGNLRLSLHARVNTLLFGDLVVKNINGKVQASGGVATLENMNMELLNGNILLDGRYSTVGRPAIDFNARAAGIDLDEAYKSFSFIRETLPVALHCRGKVSVTTRLAAELDREMSPVISTMSGDGSLAATGILIDGNPVLDELATLLHNEELSRLSISNLKIDFTMDRGNITVKPFTTRFAGQPVTMRGTQGAGGEMDYTLSVNVAREHFGKEIEKLLAPLPGSSRIKDVDIDVKIRGMLHAPTFSLDLSRVQQAVENAVKEQVKENLQEELKKGLDKLFKKK